ncbi:MAG TPA: gluconokinase, GntK/IdnK-type, partial [Reyranella sp.]|nr:gluconokinase, GntK/IdnK-type [Reyranella sp.]
MGVAGCGKTAVASALAAALGWRFIEGDTLHPRANVERMASGLPLTDEHRWGWLDAVGGRIALAGREGVGSVAACSALKRVYRDRLRQSADGILFVYLEIDKAAAALRV